MAGGTRPPMHPLAGGLAPQAPNFEAGRYMAQNVETDRRKENKPHQGSQKRRACFSVKVAVTEPERRTIEERAARAGLSLSGFGRACLLGEAGPRAKRAPPVNRQLLSAATAELNKVGSNINQIARALNSGQAVSSQAIQKATEELSITLQAILEAAGKG